MAVVGGESGEEEEQVFTNPHLERFRIMSKSQKGQALVAMLRQALASPHIFVYGEILALPNIAEMKEGPNSALYELLTVFAYGRLEDYEANSAKFGPLDPAAYRKLQCLTLVSLANESKCISYDLLFSQLKVNNVRELEDLIIDAIYHGLIKAKMEQKRRVLLVQTAVSRDIRVKGGEVGDVESCCQLDKMAQVLDTWSHNCQSVLSKVESEVDLTKKHLEDLYNHRIKVETEVISTRQALVQDEQNKQHASNNNRVQPNFSVNDLADSNPHSSKSKSGAGGGEKKYPKIKAAFGGVGSSKTPSKK